MIIGLVLYNSSITSETFFVSKIKVLQALGYHIFVFANDIQEDLDCTIIPNPKVSKNRLYLFLKMMITYLVLFLKYPRISLKFLNLEKNDGVRFFERWENLYLNSNILKYKLDWLHFGFTTIALRRENVAKAINAKMGISLRGYDICIYPLKNQFCYQHLWKKIDKVHSISKKLLVVAKDQGLPNDVKQLIINPAIDTEKFKQGFNTNKKYFNETVKFLTVARLHWKKGLDHTLQALVILKEHNINFNYILIGEGKELERLKFTIHQLDLTHQVVLLGPIPHSEIIEYYKNADIYLQYSIQEGFCNSVIEAQAMGLLTIVSNAEGLSENVVNGVTGWVVEKRKPKLLAKKIQEVLQMKNSKLQIYRKNAIERAVSEFSLSKQKNKYHQFFEE